MGTIWQDIKFGLRMLARNPGFAATAIITLALAIGANTALFSVVDAVLFRALPVHHPAELVRIGESVTGELPASQSISWPLYEEYRDHSDDIFSSVAAYSDHLHVTIAQNAGVGAPATAAVVTGNYFLLLGVHPWRGRLISDDDDRANVGQVVVLSYRYWQQAFGASNAVLAATLRVNGFPYAVIGVAPRDFYGVGLNSIPDVWLPMASATRAEPVYRGQMEMPENPFFGAVGRMKPGVTMPQAQERLSAVAAHMGAGQAQKMSHSYAGNTETTTWVKPFPLLTHASDQAGRSWSRVGWLLLGVCALVLLIGATDLASLLLARAERRQQETAIRVALGASRGQILRALLVETLLLAGMGAAAGLVVAAWCVKLVEAAGSAQTGLPVATATSILDPRVLVFTAAFAVFAGVIFSLAPAWHVTRRDALPALKSDRRTSANGRPLLRGGLIVFQIAASALLLAGTGLLLRTLRTAASQNPGFDANHVLAADMSLAKQGYSPAEAKAALQSLLDSISAAPGVESAAIESGATTQSSSPRHDWLALWRVTPSYFEALGVAIERGRMFTEFPSERGPYEGVVNARLAREHWPGEDPIGKVIGPLTPLGAEIRVVGLVPNIRTFSLAEEAPPTLYVSLSQFYSAYPWQPGITLLTRTAGAPQGALPALVAAVSRVNKDLVLLRPASKAAQLSGSFDLQRFLAVLLAAFALLAVLLAATGLYGLISYSTAARTREIGVRMALGATRSDVLRLVLRGGFSLALAGVVVGLAGALALTQVVEGLLYGVHPNDPVTFASVTFILLVVTLAACYFPARRASRIDPMIALRSE